MRYELCQPVSVTHYVHLCRLDNGTVAWVARKYHRPRKGFWIGVRHIESKAKVLCRTAMSMEPFEGKLKVQAVLFDSIHNPSWALEEHINVGHE